MKNKNHTVRTNPKSNIIIITLYFTNFILCPDLIDIYPNYSCQQIYCNNMSLYYFPVTISEYFWLKHGGNSTNVITQHKHCRQRAPIENVWSTSGYFKAVFLKQTRVIIVSIYKYTVYIMF